MKPWFARLGVLVALCAADLAWAREGGEYQVKAAFLFNFSKYVDWPQANAEPLDVCVLGSNPFNGELERALAGKKVSGRGFRTRNVHSTAEAELCDIVFVAASEAPRLDEILGRLSKKPVLTVSDIEGFAGRGGIIGLTFVGNKVRFEVNMVASRASGLKLSAHLLKVARQVIGQLDEGQ